MPIVALLTDFGVSDGFAGAMKGVILGIAPETALIDISHDVPPQDIRAGAFVLKAASPYFPSGTIFCAIVDPGVGSARRIIAVRTARASFVAPDNGLLSWALRSEHIQAIVEVTEPRYWLPEVSRTFHGRDIFAPVAAHLAAGLPIDYLGFALQDVVHFPLPEPRLESGGDVRGEVIYVDHFGNMVTDIELDPRDNRITNLPGDERGVHITADTRIRVGDRWVKALANSYADVEPGELLALVGSSGHLELALRNGSAALALGAGIGTPIRVSGVRGEPHASPQH